jgi:hypothetical protein
LYVIVEDLFHGMNPWKMTEKDLILTYATK